MRVFLDTNILLDVLLNRPGFVEDSEAAILRCEALGAERWIAWHGLARVYYLLRRGRTEAETLRQLGKILAWAQVAPVGDAQARQARSLDFPDFEDAMQAVCAEGCGANWLITRDAQGFRKCPVPIAHPAEFIAIVR